MSCTLCCKVTMTPPPAWPGRAGEGWGAACDWGLLNWVWMRLMLMRMRCTELYIWRSMVLEMTRRRLCSSSIVFWLNGAKKVDIQQKKYVSVYDLPKVVFQGSPAGRPGKRSEQSARQFDEGKSPTLDWQHCTLAPPQPHRRCSSPPYRRPRRRWLSPRTSAVRCPLGRRAACSHWPLDREAQHSRHPAPARGPPSLALQLVQRALQLLPLQADLQQQQLELGLEILPSLQQQVLRLRVLLVPEPLFLRSQQQAHSRLWMRNDNFFSYIFSCERCTNKDTNNYRSRCRDWWRWVAASCWKVRWRGKK